MKKIIILVFILVSTSACDLISITTDSKTYENLQRVRYNTLSGYDFSNLTSIRKVGNWLSNNVIYSSVNGEVFQSADETLYRGYGDCEDYVIAMMNIAYITLGIKMDMVLVNVSSRTIVEGGRANHVVARYNSANYNAQDGYTSRYQDVLYIYTFDEVFPTTQ